MKNDIKLHPDYWELHKKYWTEEFNNLDNDISRMVVDNPYGAEAKILGKKVTSKIRDAMSQRNLA